MKGGRWQTVLTYVNYSPQSVTCTTNFFADDGTPLKVAFGGAASTTRTDTLLAGGSIHSLSTAGALATGGWAQAVCSGPVKASMLFRWNNLGAAITEAGVNAATTPTTKFATYATTQTGAAFANTPLDPIGRRHDPGTGRDGERSQHPPCDATTWRTPSIQHLRLVQSEFHRIHADRLDGGDCPCR